MKIIIECSNKILYEEVNAAIKDFCNNIDEYDFYMLYKYVLKKYKLFLFYNPHEDQYYISDDWCLLI